MDAADTEHEEVGLNLAELSEEMDVDAELSENMDAGVELWVDPDTNEETRSKDKEMPSSSNTVCPIFWFKARRNNRRRPCKPKKVPFCH